MRQALIESLVQLTFEIELPGLREIDPAALAIEALDVLSHEKDESFACDLARPDLFDWSVIEDFFFEMDYITLESAS